MEYFKLVVEFYILVYGLSLGIRNTWYRVTSVLSYKTLNQSITGRTLDMVWYVTIGYYIYMSRGL